MQDVYNEFEKRNTVVIAIAQEDTDLKSHGKMLASFETKPPFHIVADLNREKTTRYHRTTAYLIDTKGVVREIFPMLIHHRPSWEAILGAVDKMLETDATESP